MRAPIREKGQETVEEEGDKERQRQMEGEKERYSLCNCLTAVALMGLISERMARGRGGGRR